MGQPALASRCIDTIASLLPAVPSIPYTRMSGVDLGREIRQRYPGLPVVLTSGYSHVLAEEGRHGFELLHKPYAVEDVSRVLRRVTQGRG
jgi:DNA-binding NtrC family response regulator